MNFFSAKEASEKWHISSRRVTRLAAEGRIKGAKLIGNSWMIPTDAPKPSDGRKRSSKLKPNHKYIFPLIIYGVSSKDNIEKDYTPEEQKLIKASFEIESGNRNKEAIALLESLLSETQNPYLQISALYELHYLYIYELEFDKAIEAGNRFKILILDAEDHKEELYYLYKEFEITTEGSSWITNSFEINNNCEYSESFLPFLATLCIFSDLSSFETNEPRLNIQIYETIVLKLEQDGYFFAAMIVHFYISIMCEIKRQTEKKLYHLRKCFDIAIERNCFSYLALLVSYFPDLKTVIRNYYDEELINNIDTLAKNILTATSEFLKYAGKSKLFSKLDFDDYKLISYAQKGYSINKISELEQTNISSLKRQLRLLYKKLEVKNKKELVEKYHRELQGIRNANLH